MAILPPNYQPGVSPVPRNPSIEPWLPQPPVPANDSKLIGGTPSTPYPIFDKPDYNQALMDQVSAFNDKNTKITGLRNDYTKAFNDPKVQIPLQPVMPQPGQGWRVPPQTAPVPMPQPVKPAPLPGQFPPPSTPVPMPQPLPPTPTPGQFPPPSTRPVTMPQPAIPATPAIPGGKFGPATPAIPAQPAVPVKPAKPTVPEKKIPVKKLYKRKLAYQRQQNRSLNSSNLMSLRAPARRRHSARTQDSLMRWSSQSRTSAGIPIVK